ncbi:GerAB/ArcD/ProY family transporter [Paenisporosarcina sp. TG-14]|uniref:GerAB/ArcD/ProY family transporter n=1 Tax=Paenisporosarcina sp. TG-14 TaxID=1231057 RepID=UPI00031C17C3|nr:endospore germination permease [Paenisporosarcina sp. TG-14]
MVENGKIEAKQFMKLVILYTIGSSVLLLPPFLAEKAKQDAWIASIISVCIALILVWIYKTLGSLFPNMSLVEYSQKILGKWLGKITSVLVFIYALLLTALTLREIGDFVVTLILPETPIESILILFISVVIIGVRYGLENIARTSELFFPWVLFLFLIFFLFLVPEIEIQKIQPILAKGIKPILGATFFQIGFPFLELVLLLMIFPYVNRTREAGKAFITGTLIGGIILVLITFLSVSILGAESTANEIYSTFSMAEKINIADFIQRMELILTGIWFLIIFLKLSICYYVSVLVLAQTIQISDYRPLTLPLGLILVILSLVISPNISYYHTFISDIWTPYSLMFGLILPLLLLVVTKVKTKIYGPKWN